jgi:DNA-binding transcriptional MerR regulator
MMRSNGQLTIGQLARTMQIAASTIRYYERIGLLLPEDRSHGNYRLYTDASRRRLRFIRAAQSIGFTLDDIRTLVSAQNGTGPSCRDVQTLIEHRLADIETQLNNLQQVRRLLKSSLRKCRTTKQPQRCHAIESLKAAAGG